MSSRIYVLHVTYLALFHLQVFLQEAERWVWLRCGVRGGHHRCRRFTALRRKDHRQGRQGRVKVTATTRKVTVRSIRSADRGKVRVKVYKVRLWNQSPSDWYQWARTWVKVIGLGSRSHALCPWDSWWKKRILSPKYGQYSSGIQTFADFSFTRMDAFGMESKGISCDIEFSGNWVSCSDSAWSSVRPLATGASQPSLSRV